MSAAPGVVERLRLLVANVAVRRCAVSWPAWQEQVLIGHDHSCDCGRQGSVGRCLGAGDRSRATDRLSILQAPQTLDRPWHLWS